MSCPLTVPIQGKKVKHESLSLDEIDEIAANTTEFHVEDYNGASPHPLHGDASGNFL